MSSFKGRDIISLRDMTIDDLWTIVMRAQEVKAGKHQDCLKGKTIASLFFEPSTRTRLSFESALKYSNVTGQAGFQRGKNETDNS